jgi:ABC-type sulfate/molybdate transport systems ATPase subunit
MIQLQQISLTYDKAILKGINLQVKRGEILGLVGKSGAGKSSLLKICAGLLDCSEGSVSIDGKKQMPVRQLLVPGYSNIAIVNQDFKLDPFHTVAENIKEAILHWSHPKRDKRVQQLIQLFGLKEICNTKAHLISGGEQQRVAIARAIADQPQYLLLDEPFGHLDAKLRQRLSSYLMDLRDAENTGIVLVSHEGQDVLGLCDHICILQNGKISKKYLPETLYYRYAAPDKARLFGPLNTLKWNGNTEHFRPDEYQISQKGIPLNFERAVFVGSYYHNYFSTALKERILLYAFEPLSQLSHIEIKRK